VLAVRLDPGPLRDRQRAGILGGGTSGASARCSRAVASPPNKDTTLDPDRPASHPPGQQSVTGN
jgi:hypothetical protein